MRRERPQRGLGCGKEQIKQQRRHPPRQKRRFQPCTRRTKTRTISHLSRSCVTSGAGRRAALRRAVTQRPQLALISGLLDPPKKIRHWRRGSSLRHHRLVPEFIGQADKRSRRRGLKRLPDRLLHKLPPSLLRESRRQRSLRLTLNLNPGAANKTSTALKMPFFRRTRQLLCGFIPYMSICTRDR